MKIALLQGNMVTGDVLGNAGRILTAVRKAADEGASLCVTPELALCGVAPQDILLAEGFVDGCQKVLKDMAEKLRSGPAVLVGAALTNPVAGDKLFSNAAVLMQGGLCTVVSRKVYPVHGDAGSDARYFDRGVSCGLMTLQGWRLGVVLCEESGQKHAFWKIQHAHTHNPLMELVSRGVDCIVHMAATPYVMGFQGEREHLLSHVAARHHVHLLSANMVGGNDGSVYAGQSVAFGPTGALLARGRAFDEDILVVNTTTAANTATARPCASPEEECWKALVLGVRDYVRKSGAERVLLGLSGGIDSALVAALAVEALGADKVRGVLMPSPHTSPESQEYSMVLAKTLGMPHVTIPISPMMDIFAAALAPVFAGQPVPAEDMTMENIQARIRGVLLMALANHSGAMVLNTGNKSEAAMGYCTLYGDAVGALAVIGDVPKTMVYRLAHWYNERHKGKGIPEGILTRPPTAELRPGQLDSDALPPYDELDPLLERLLSGPTAPAEEKERTRDATPLERVTEVFTRMRNAEFKRRQGPLALRVTGRAFGEDWRIPVVSKVTLP